jgi:hypothetical protein
MAKKRRKRRSAGPGPRPKAGQRKQRAAVEPAARLTARDERPQGPWGSFPLTELTILVGLVLLVLGFVRSDASGTFLIAAGITIAGLGGLELAIREHFAGYRSHSALLAFACAVFCGGALVVLALLVFGSVIPAIAVAAAAIAFVPAFLALRRAFRRASGGFSYRIGRLRG